MATTRMEVRVEEEVKARVEKASALRGFSTLSAYVTHLIDTDATEVIAQHESITVENDIFDRFMDACNKSRKPNQALLDAASFTKKQGIK